MEPNEKYNGWTNYPTWRINLELIDDYGYSLHKDGQKYGDIQELAAIFQEYTEEAIGGFGDLENNGTARLAINYAMAFIDDVNWHEIANHWQSLISIDLDAFIDTAYELGQEHGKAAATWIFDGNTDDATYRRYARGIDEGDPDIMDRFDLNPLSGEMAGSMTPRILHDAIDLPEGNDDAHDDIDTAYENGYSEAFMEELESTIRRHLTNTEGTN